MSADALTLSDLAALILEVRADLRALISERSKKAIEPSAIYSIREAAALVPVSAKVLREKCACGYIRARGPRYRIRGSELLKLA